MELHARLARGTAGLGDAALPADVRLDVDDETKLAVTDDVLLHGTDEEVAEMSMDAKRLALDMLADLALDSKTSAERDLHEIVLARALCRTMLL